MFLFLSVLPINLIPIQTHRVTIPDLKKDYHFIYFNNKKFLVKIVTLHYHNNLVAFL